MEKPLKTILCTQMPDQFEKFKSYFHEKFKLVNFPMIKIEYNRPNENIYSILQNIEQFNWLIFTSMRGVIGFFNLTHEVGISDEKIRSKKIACIGRSTAKELENYDLRATYINPGNTSEEFGYFLINEQIKSDDNILLAVGERADDYLQTILQKHCSVNRVNVYKTIDVEHVDKQFFEMVENDQYDLLVFTSPSAFENFVRLGDYQPGNPILRIASIGGRTSKAIEKLGFEVSITAKKSDLEGLAIEIENYIKN